MLKYHHHYQATICADLYKGIKDMLLQDDRKLSSWLSISLQQLFIDQYLFCTSGSSVREVALSTTKKTINRAMVVVRAWLAGCGMA